MAKADRDEADRLNSKNSVEEYIYEIRELLIDLLSFNVYLSGARFATSWKISCWKETERSSRGI